MKSALVKIMANSGK